jgi:hypothetical protein
MTPLDWLTSAMVTLDMPPFSSARTMALPMRLALRMPPLTVLRVAVPLPALMAFQRSLLDIRGCTPLLKKHRQEICKRSNPKCEICPLTAQCAYIQAKVADSNVEWGASKCCSPVRSRGRQAAALQKAVLGRGRDEQGALADLGAGRFLDLAGRRLNNGKA